MSLTPNIQSHARDRPGMQGGWGQIVQHCRGSGKEATSPTSLPAIIVATSSSLYAFSLNTQTNYYNIIKPSKLSTDRRVLE